MGRLAKHFPSRAEYYDAEDVSEDFDLESEHVAEDENVGSAFEHEQISTKRLSLPKPSSVRHRGRPPKGGSSTSQPAPHSARRKTRSSEHTGQTGKRKSSRSRSSTPSTSSRSTYQNSWAGDLLGDLRGWPLYFHRRATISTILLAIPLVFSTAFFILLLPLILNAFSAGVKWSLSRMCDAGLSSVTSSWVLTKAGITDICAIEAKQVIPVVPRDPTGALAIDNWGDRGAIWVLAKQQFEHLTGEIVDHTARLNQWKGDLKKGEQLHEIGYQHRRFQYEAEDLLRQLYAKDRAFQRSISIELEVLCKSLTREIVRHDSYWPLTYALMEAWAEWFPRIFSKTPAGRVLMLLSAFADYQIPRAAQMKEFSDKVVLALQKTRDAREELIPLFELEYRDWYSDCVTGSTKWGGLQTATITARKYRCSAHVENQSLHEMLASEAEWLKKVEGYAKQHQDAYSYLQTHYHQVSLDLSAMGRGEDSVAIKFARSIEYVKSIQRQMLDSRETIAKRVEFTRPFDDSRLITAG